MRFVVDNQLPPSLSRHLVEAGHDAVHVANVGLDASSDLALWSWAQREGRVIVSKDEDLFYLANRAGESGQLLWVRVGNCRKDALLAVMDRALPSIVEAFAAGQRIVEISG